MTHCPGPTREGPDTCRLPAGHRGTCLPFPYADTVPALTTSAAQLDADELARAVTAHLPTQPTTAYALPSDCGTCWGSGHVGPAGEPWALYESTAGHRTLSGWFAGPITPQPCPTCTTGQPPTKEQH